jgi:hypothetical protein
MNTSSARDGKEMSTTVSRCSHLDEHNIYVYTAGAAAADGRPALGAEGRPSQVALSKSHAVFSAHGKLLVVSAWQQLAQVIIFCSSSWCS